MKYAGFCRTYGGGKVRLAAFLMPAIFNAVATPFVTDNPIAPIITTFTSIAGGIFGFVAASEMHIAAEPIMTRLKIDQERGDRFSKRLQAGAYSAVLLFAMAGGHFGGYVLNEARQNVIKARQDAQRPIDGPKL